MTLGEPAISALDQALADKDTAIEARRALPAVLQRLASPSAERLLVDHVLDPDPILRLRVLTALNKVRQLHPGRRLERELIETVLAAEIYGHYRSYQILGQLMAQQNGSGDAGIAEAKDAIDRELERIFRLLKLLFPAQDFHSAYVGLHAGNATVHANALEFLQHSMPAGMRRLLLPLIDNEVGLRERLLLADRLVGNPISISEPDSAARTASDALLRDAAQQAKQQLEGP